MVCNSTINYFLLFHPDSIDGSTSWKWSNVFSINSDFNWSSCDFDWFANTLDQKSFRIEKKFLSRFSLDLTILIKSRGAVVPWQNLGLWRNFGVRGEFESWKGDGLEQ